MFLLLAELNAKPSTASEVEFLLRELTSVARHEAGNMVYAVHRTRDTPNHFILYELYKDRNACDAHLASLPVQQALAKFESLLDVPPRIVFCDTVASTGISSAGD